MSSIETATIDEMIVKVHRLSRNQLYIHQDNVMMYYDRIIRNHAILYSRKFGIPDNVYKLHCHIHDKIQFKN